MKTSNLNENKEVVKCIKSLLFNNNHFGFNVVKF